MINTVRKMYQRIRDLREDRDLSQAALAKLLNVSQSTYSRYESGYLDIPSNILIALARFYQVSVDYILGLIDAQEASLRAYFHVMTTMRPRSDASGIPAWFFYFFCQRKPQAAGSLRAETSLLFTPA